MVYDDEEEDSTTYSWSITCDNCTAEYDYDIPKGITIADYVKNNNCEECGCKLYQETTYDDLHEKDDE